MTRSEVSLRFRSDIVPFRFLKSSSSHEFNVKSLSGKKESSHPIMLIGSIRPGCDCQIHIIIHVTWLLK